MKPISRTIVAASLAAAGLLATPAHAEQASPAGPAYTTGDEVRQEFAEALAALRTYSYHKRDQALEQAERMLLQLDREIEALENRLQDGWQDMSEAAREKAAQSREALRRSRDRLKARYDALKQSSETAWDELKDGFAGAYRDVEDA